MQKISLNKDHRLRHSHFRSSAGLRKLREWAVRISEQSDNQYIERSIITDFGITHVYDTAEVDLPALVFVHGWFCNAMMWDVGNDLHLLAKTHRLILMDVIGQPGFSSQASPPVKGPAYGHWLVQVLDRLDVQNCSIAGMSFGGFLSVKLAQVAAHRIDRIILLGPAGFVPLIKNPGLLMPFLKPLIAPNRANIRKFAARMLVTSSHSLSNEAYENIIDLFEVGFRYFRASAQPPHVFRKGELECLTMPVMLLVGSEDALFKAGPMLERAQREIPDLRLGEIMQGYGHGISNSRLVVEKVAGFLNDEEKT